MHVGVHEHTLTLTSTHTHMYRHTCNIESDGHSRNITPQNRNTTALVGNSAYPIRGQNRMYNWHKFLGTLRHMHINAWIILSQYVDDNISLKA